MGQSASSQRDGETQRRSPPLLAPSEAPSDRAEYVAGQGRREDRRRDRRRSLMTGLAPDWSGAVNRTRPVSEILPRPEEFEDESAAAANNTSGDSGRLNASENQSRTFESSGSPGWLSRRMRERQGTATGSEEDRRRLDSSTIRSRLTTRFGRSRPSQTEPERARQGIPSLLRRGADRSPSPRRRQRIGSISNPLPFEPTDWPLSQDAAPPEGTPLDPSDPMLHRSRLSRVRNSIISPMSGLFHHWADHSVNDTDEERPNARSADARSSDDGRRQRSRSAFGVENNDPGLPSSLFTARPRSHHFRQRSERDPDRDVPPERSLRGLPNSFRRSSTRHRQGEDQAAMLSRLLSVAAAATAASLVGESGQSFSQAQDVGDNGPDGSFEGFLRTLRNGSLASALRNGGRETGGNGSDPPAGDGSLAPVNFFRMFRFGAVTEGGPGRNVYGNGETSAASDSTEGTSAEGNDGEAQGGRMIPVIIVGIRSVTARWDTNQEDGSTTPPFFDAFSNLPLTLPNVLPRGGSGTLMRRTDRRRFGRSRRSSSSATNSHGHDGPRQSANATQPTEMAGSSRDSSLPTVLSDSPPGPHPPPSTPADHALSAFPSGESTPNQRPSSASAVSPPTSATATSSSWRDSPTVRSGGGNLGTTAEEESPPSARARRRRVSDGEFSTYHDLGSGSSRRNGIVGNSEFDDAPPSPPANNANTSSDEPRSWIIYVLGGSYPEDHPILTTPSLFTDSPTYEDMLLISSLVGPAKPPIASPEDVGAAGGIFKIHLVDNPPGKLVAREVTDDGEEIELLPGQQCLVCICDYLENEETRRLAKCNHLFHRECIDEWLTTGRNSCPLCRGQGVEEKASGRQQSQPQTTPSPQETS